VRDRLDKGPSLELEPEKGNNFAGRTQKKGETNKGRAKYTRAQNELEPARISEAPCLQIPDQGCGFLENHGPLFPAGCPRGSEEEGRLSFGA